MALAPGEKLGPYEIIEAIGQGGMGAVYRARDTRLGRDVAIKVSDQRFSERFEREARVISSLNHPSICHLYDVGDNYLVMELVEGQTLSERIKEGPIPLEDSLAIARQIAAALEAAHEKGITHRDLKPGNVMIKDDGSVKVLDFGLAKVGPKAISDDDPELSPTISLAATQAGVILGTAAYMSPEQARGKPVDKRADIWAFGVVLYEIVTGQKLFKGEDLTETLAFVVTKDPDLSAAPAELQPLLKKCLEKDPRKRLRDISGVDLLLAHGRTESQLKVQDHLANSDGLSGSGRNWLWPAVTAAAIIVAGITIWAPWSVPGSADTALVHLNLDLSGVVGGRDMVALSPDGKRIAYVSDDSGTQMLVTRLLEEPEWTVLPGTENATNPFFSPDGQWIGFSQNSRLKKVSVRGGASVDLVNAPLFIGASWGEDGYIVAALNAGEGLSRFPDSGGSPELITDFEGVVFGHPQILPAGDAVLFDVRDPYNEIRAVTLATGEVKTLVQGSTFAWYLATGGPDSIGHLVYVNQDTLFAAPFDPRSLEIAGEAVPVLDHVPNGISFSGTGEAVYGIGSAGPREWPVQWVTRSGEVSPLLTEPGYYSVPRFSPDGRVLALEDGPGASQVLTYDWQNDTILPLSDPDEVASYPVWSPDGRYLAMILRTRTQTSAAITWRRADGSGQTHTLLEGDYRLGPFSISPDGRYLAFAEQHPQTSWDLWWAPLDLSDPERPVLGEREVFLQSPRIEQAPVFSPDGNWIAYFSDESGQYEVYVQPFPGPGARRKISEAGGIYPKWSTNGRELLFNDIDRYIMVVDYQINGDAFTASRPRRWNDVRIRGVNSSNSWALHPDGERIAAFPREDASAAESAPTYGFVLNFFEELKRRAPVRGN